MNQLSDTAHLGKLKVKRLICIVSATPLAEVLFHIAPTDVSYCQTAPSRLCKITSQLRTLRDDSDIKY